MTDLRLLQEEIAGLLLDNLQVEVHSVHEDLLETGLLDSLKIVELLAELEQRFAMKISLKDLEIDSFRSVAAMAELVAKAKADSGIPVEAAAPGLSDVMPSLLAD